MCILQLYIKSYYITLHYILLISSYSFGRKDVQFHTVFSIMSSGVNTILYTGVSVLNNTSPCNQGGTRPSSEASGRR